MADRQVTSAVTRVARYCMVGTLNLYGIMSKLFFYFFLTLAATMNRTPQRLESSCYLRYVNVLPKIPPKKERCVYIHDSVCSMPQSQVMRLIDPPRPLVYITVVSCIYTPCFATLVLVESLGGLYVESSTLLVCPFNVL